MIWETVCGVGAVLVLLWWLWPLLVPDCGPWVRYFDGDE